MIDNGSCLNVFHSELFALSVLTPCSPFSYHASLIAVLNFPAFSPENGTWYVTIFHITCREFTYFHILKIRAAFLTISIYQRLWNFISNMKKQFRKNISHACCHLSRSTTKPTKWPVRHGILRSGWASAQYDQSLRCPHKEPLCSCLSI